jgi:hypothetical protein
MEQRAVIRFLTVKGLKVKDIQTELEHVCEDEMLSKFRFVMSAKRYEAGRPFVGLMSLNEEIMMDGCRFLSLPETASIRLHVVSL